MLKLIVLTGTEEGKEFTYGGQPLTIGRSNTCDVVLHDAIVSRRHCRIEQDDRRYLLTDLQSGNGTFVNNLDTRISTHVLTNGDVILVGKTSIRVDLSAEADEAETPLAVLPRTTVPAAESPQRINETPAVPPQGRGEQLAAIRQPDVPIVVTVVSGPDHGLVYSPAREVFTIGRAETCDIVLHDRRVSRLHVSLKREHGKYRLYDENSANGTFLRTPHERVFRADLIDGDIIYLGQTQLRVEVRTLALAPPPPTDDATVVSGTVAGKSFSFNLNALAAAARMARSEDRTYVGTEENVESHVDEALDSRSQPTPSAPQITLRVLEGKDTGATFTPATGTQRFSVGRGELADFRLQDRGVSQLHFTVEQIPTGFALTDDGSRNGTFLNDGTQRLTRLVLHGGEEIRIGETRLKVEITGAPATSASVPPRTPEDATTFLPPPMEPSAPAAAATPASTAEERPTSKNVRSRSEAFKERLAAIARQKGISLRPVTLPGSPRHWATLLLMLFAAALSYGFLAVGRDQPFSSGPVIQGHAKWENQCATCHPAWGVKPVNATCVTTECHADVVKTTGTVRDNCVSCHTEHRGRTFNMKGGETQCWACHKAGLGVRAFAVRPLQSYYKDVFAIAAQTVPQPGKVSKPAHVQPATLQASRQQWLQGVAARPTGLKYGHAIHARDVLQHNNKQEQCQDCHVKLPDSGLSVLPTHAECIDCHKEVADRDPQIAKQHASEQCVKCHLEKDGGVNRIQRTTAFVNFRHDDHGITRCVQCHAIVTSEDEYRPVQRSAIAYPVPMEACYTCHQERKATLACLDCHRSHHSFPSLTTVASAWLEHVPLSAVLFLFVALIAGASVYTYGETRVTLRWLESLEQTTGKPSEEPSPSAGGAGDGVPSGNAPTPVGEGGVLPFPTVDAATCISCSSCYDSCPTNVLAGDPVSHKSTVVNPNACTALEGCTICQDGCPTGAIRVTSAPLVKETERPQMDQHNESNVAGLFLVGEVVGAALIKKAVNQGDQTIRYIFNRKPRVATAPYDVIIVGAGPGGLAAGLEAQRLGLRYLVLERETLASTIQNYPRDKAVLAEPVLLSVYGLLPMKDATKEELIKLWEEIVRKSGLQVNTREEVATVTKAGDLFTVVTTKGSYQGSYIVLATGTRGNPRKLGAVGEDLPKVAYSLIDAAEWRGKNVLVVGGGDSAIEAAVALAKEPDTTVTLSYRRGEFSRIKSRNEHAIAEQQKIGRVTVLFHSTVQSITVTHVTLKIEDEVRVIDNDAVFALIGADPPKAWLEKIGVQFTMVKETVGAQW